ncbi:DUF4911 domain-containing protein [Desulfospira joergensenii]|uniref:DUF4911 domain-containing protein n=1 Tax=Desulfospira joergensenii TaxID=53329 RepID=UPI0003B4FDFA|nr:DUF4911 domain-containing protein [Desulfospira joergensenii]
METIRREYRVDKARIGFIRFIFEAHEGIGVVTTLDPAQGHIRISMPPDRTKTVSHVIEDLKKDFRFDEI